MISAAIATSSRRVVLALPGVRAGVHPEPLHRARVGTRRLRSHLRVFSSLLDEEWATGLHTELDQFGRVLGDVRDLDVLLTMLVDLVRRESMLDIGDLNALIGHFVRQRAERRQILLEVLDRDAAILLVDRLVSTLDAVPTVSRADRPASEILPALTRRPWRRIKRAMADITPDSPMVDLHRIRILAKRCRYTADAVACIASSSAGEFSAAMGRIQDCLGQAHDAFAISHQLRAAAADRPELGYAAGQVSGILTARADGDRAELAAVWKQASKKRLREWW